MLLNLAVHLNSCAGGDKTPESTRHNSSWLLASFKFISRAPNNGGFLQM